MQFALKIYRGRRLIFNSRNNPLEHLPQVTPTNAHLLRVWVVPCAEGLDAKAVTRLAQKYIRQIKALSQYPHSSFYLEIQYWIQPDSWWEMIESGLCVRGAIGLTRDLIDEVARNAGRHIDTYVYFQVCPEHSH